MNDKNIYWANLCILNRKEGELMEEAAEKWERDSGRSYGMTYLGDTEEVKMHQKVEEDIDAGLLGFDLLVSSRFDLFCCPRYLLGQKDRLKPLGGRFPVREEVKACGVEDPFGLYHPLVVLPHFMLCNTEMLGDRPAPTSLEQLLDPEWAGQVVVGNTELPSGQSVLFAMWYLFGDEGLEACVRNWRQKSAPSAVRHGLLKGEFSIGLLPGIFCGPGPRDQVQLVRPTEGLPVLPSYAAAKNDGDWEDSVAFLGGSAASEPFLEFYRDMAHGIASDPSVPMPELAEPGDELFFPPWDWILEQDLDGFRETVLRIPSA